MKKGLIMVLTAVFTLALSITAFAGEWKQDTKGWWWDNGDGTYPKNAWQWCDGNGDGISECYYFDGNGYCLMNTTTPDGYLVDANGAWVVDGKVQTQGAAKAAPVQNIILKPGTYIENSQIPRYTRKIVSADAETVIVSGFGSLPVVLKRDWEHTSFPKYDATGGGLYYTIAPRNDGAFLEQIMDMKTWKIQQINFIYIG